MLMRGFTYTFKPILTKLIFHFTDARIMHRSQFLAAPCPHHLKFAVFDLGS